MSRERVVFLSSWFFLFGVWGGSVWAQAPKLRSGATLPQLRSAYQRERRELLSQLRTLEKTLRGLKRQNRLSQSKLSREVRRLSVRASALRKQTDLWEERASVLQQRLRGHGGGATLRATFRLAAAQLRKYGIVVSTQGSAPVVLERLVKASLRLIREFGQVTRKQGRFYTQDGRQVDGVVVWLGRFAALGVSAQQSGVLQPAPGSSYRLRSTDSATAALARRWKAKNGSLAPVMLYDPLRKNIESAKKNSWSKTVEAGGPIAVIILLLAGLGSLLVLERLVTLFRLTNWRAKNFENVLRCARTQSWEDARLAAQKMAGASTVLESVLSHPGDTRDSLQETAGEAVLKLLPPLQRSMTMLNVIVTVAPLLGLLGTVTGMIATFEVITSFGTGNPKLLSQGISEALITTKLGLAVAVPFLLVKSFVARWADRLLEGIQLQAISLINTMHEKRTPDGGSLGVDI